MLGVASRLETLHESEQILRHALGERLFVLNEHGLLFQSRSEGFDGDPDRGGRERGAVVVHGPTQGEDVARLGVRHATTIRPRRVSSLDIHAQRTVIV